MDIGINGDDDYAALAQSFNAVKQLEKICDSLPPVMTDLAVEGSELAWALENVPEPLVDLRYTFYSALATARGNLWQICELFDKNQKTTPSVLQTLLRAALLSAARVAYPVLAADREQLVYRLTVVMAQEGKSLKRLYRDASNNVELLSLIPPRDIVDKQELRFSKLGLTNRDILSDSAMLEQVAMSIARLQDQYDDLNEEALKEQYSWIFHCLSGVSHGFGWTKLVPGTESMSGHFVADFFSVASLAWIAGHQLMVCAGRSNGR